jgi:hypothetical protein
MVDEKVIENPEAKPVPVLEEASEKDEVKTKESVKVERLNCSPLNFHAYKSLIYFILCRLTNALQEKQEEIVKWKANCLFLKKLLEFEKDVTELQVSEVSVI